MPNPSPPIELVERGGTTCPHCGTPLASAERTRRTRTARCRGRFGGHYTYTVRELRCAGCRRLVPARKTEQGFVTVPDPGISGPNVITELEREQLGQAIELQYAEQDRS
ncbi:MAG: hypothetical protein AAF799_12910 [Myxococcota bacterium]